MLFRLSHWLLILPNETDKTVDKVAKETTEQESRTPSRPCTGPDSNSNGGVLHEDSILLVESSPTPNGTPAAVDHRHSGDASPNHNPHSSGAQIMPVLKNPNVLLALTGDHE